MSDPRRVVHVGIADMKIVEAPQIIRTSGLGSCVAVIIFDQEKQLAGLAHIMLPDSTMAKGGPINKAKFADTAVKELIDRLLRKGLFPQRLQAKICGGAEMFDFTNKRNLLRIGERNIEAVRKSLSLFKVRIVAEDVGGKSGRSVEFNPETSILTISTIDKGIKVL